MGGSRCFKVSGVEELAVAMAWSQHCQPCSLCVAAGLETETKVEVESVQCGAKWTGRDGHSPNIDGKSVLPNES